MAPSITQGSSGLIGAGLLMAGLLVGPPSMAQVPETVDPFEDLKEIRSREQSAQVMDELRSQRRAGSTTQRLILPYYSMSDGAGSLWLLNQFVDPIEVSISVFNPAGGQVPLGSSTVEARSHLEVDLAELLGQLGQTPAFSQGSLQVEYFGDSQMLSGWFVTWGPGGTSELSLVGKQKLSGPLFTSFWDKGIWLIGLRPVYHLHNASSLPLTARVRIADGRAEPTFITLRIPPGGLRSVKPEGSRGWIEIAHDGEPGSLAVAGRLEGEGFLSRLPIFQPRAPEAIRTWEVIRLPLSGPRGETWVAVLNLFNPESTPGEVSVSLLDVTSGAVLQQQNRFVPPRGTLQLADPELTAGLPEPRPTEVRVRVEGTGVLPWGVALPESGPPLELAFVAHADAHPSGMYPVADLMRQEVFTTLVNLGSEPAQIVAQVSWAGGEYALEPITVGPGQAHRLDLRQIASEQRPDLLGRILDPHLEGGFLQWLSHRGSMSLIARTEIRPAESGDSFGFNCFTCCEEVPFGELVPGFADFFVGQSPLFQTCVGFNTCSGTIGPFPTTASHLDYPTPFSWDGVNISAAARGSGTASFSGGEFGQTLLCQVLLFLIQDDGPVVARRKPLLTGIVPTRGLIGNKHVITLNGRDFTDSPQITIGGTGITFQILSKSDTQIRLELSVRSDATPGNHSIAVRSVDGTSNAKDFFVQTPGKMGFLAIQSVSAATLACPSGTQGFGVQVLYQVVDQAGVAITSAKMIPIESFRQRPLPYSAWAPISGNRAQQTTLSDGTYVDIPVGSCFPTPTPGSDPNPCVLVDQKLGVRVITQDVGPANVVDYESSTRVERADCLQGLAYDLFDGSVLVVSKRLGVLP